MFDDLYDLIGSKVLSPVNLYPTNANTPRYPILHILLFLMNPLIIYYISIRRYTIYIMKIKSINHMRRYKMKVGACDTDETTREGRASYSEERG